MFWQCNGCLAGVCLSPSIAASLRFDRQRQNGLHDDGSVCSTRMRVVGSAGLCSFFPPGCSNYAVGRSGGLWSATV